MNILCLHPVLSMRAVKEMAAVKAYGHKIILAYEGVGSSARVDKGEFWDKIIPLPFTKRKLDLALKRSLPFLYGNLLREIVEVEKVDLVHVFSMPDHLAVAAIKYTSVPVIYDIRDLTTGMDKAPFLDTTIFPIDKVQGILRRVLEKNFERYACSNANGIVCVTENMAHWVIQSYKVDRSKVIFLESYPCRDDVFSVNVKNVGKNSLDDGDIHLVHAGNLFSDGYKNTIDVIEQIAASRMHIHIYPTGVDTFVHSCRERFRGNIFVHFYDPLKRNDLFAELPRYDYGLVLYSPKNSGLNRRLTISNKLLEYLACGVPVACTDLEAPRQFLARHDAGFVFSDVSDLSRKAKRMKGTFSINRELFMMENHIEKLLHLYDHVLSSLR